MIDVDSVEQDFQGLSVCPTYCTQAIASSRLQGIDSLTNRPALAEEDSDLPMQRMRMRVHPKEKLTRPPERKMCTSSSSGRPSCQTPGGQLPVRSVFGECMSASLVSNAETACQRQIHQENSQTAKQPTRDPNSFLRVTPYCRGSRNRCPLVANDCS